MAGGVGHTGGLTNPRPWRGRCRAGYSNVGGPPLPRKRAPLQKRPKNKMPQDKGNTREPILFHGTYSEGMPNEVERTREKNFFVPSNPNFLVGCVTAI